VGQRLSDCFRPAQAPAFGSRVQRFEFLGREPNGDDLHRRGATSRAPATTVLQFSHVIAGIGLVGPLLDLPLARHELIV